MVKGEADSGPALPPPPLSGRRARLPALPFMGVRSLTWPIDTDAILAVALTAASGGLLGLGAVLSDRVLPTSLRRWRWMIGMGLLSALPLHTALTLIQGSLAAGELLYCASVEAVCLGLISAMYGLLAGEVADAWEGLLWELTVLGLGVGVLNGVVVTGATLPIVFGPPSEVTLVTHAALGPAVGFALANRISAARRKHEDAEEGWTGVA